MFTIKPLYVGEPVQLSKHESAHEISWMTAKVILKTPS